MSNQYLGDDRIVHESIDVSKASSRRIYSNSEAPDDIVTRLRESANYAETDGNTWAADDCREAADEIERLRADNEELLEIAKNFANEGKCYAYEDQWGMCVHSDCKWHGAEHAWESYCMRRGL